MSLQLDVRRGSQTPRVANVPPYPISAAPEVIDLARRAGLYLDEWQQYVLTHGLGQHLVSGDNGQLVPGDWTAKKVSCWVPRQNGKGAIIEALELAWLFLFSEELIIHSAHQHRTSQKAYERLERMIRRTPSMHRRVRQYRQANGEQQIELVDGRMLQYTTRSRTAVRGFSAPKIVLDEAQELNSDQIGAIVPTVSAMPNWQIWFFGTPPDDENAWVYGLREDGEAGIDRLAHFDWGAVLNPAVPGDQAKILDLETAYAANPALGGRIEVQTVLDEQKPSGLGSKYGQERIGIWKPRKAGGGVIDLAQWARIADPQSRRVGDIAFVADIAPLRDYASVSVYGLRGDGLGHGRLIDYRPGTDWMVERLAELKTVLDPVAMGMGRGTYESLKEDLAKVGIEVPEDRDDPKRGDLIVATATDMAAACGQFIDAVRQATMRVMPAPQLDESVAGAKIRQVGDTIAWVRKDATCDTSPVASLTLARWLFHTYSHLSAKDYDLLDSVA